MTLTALRPESDARGLRQNSAAKTMLAPHPSAALEYWFFKVNAGPTALLVDWIARRRANEHWLRVSIHSPHKREVLFEERAVLMPDEHDCLSARRTAGHLGEVSWELDIDPGSDRIAPDIFPARLLRMPDLLGVFAPLATFTGWIRHAEHHAAFQSAPGLVSHYWGRQLPSEWWWVSASQFDQPGIAVECFFQRSAAWGIPDTAWQIEGIELPAERPWLSRSLVDSDAEKVRGLLVRLHTLKKTMPDLIVAPAHDRRIWERLPSLTP